MMNLTASIAVLSNLELDPQDLIAGAKKFTGVKRRLEYLGQFSKIDLFFFFSHHPTSIKASIAAVKSTLDSSSLYAVVELASNTMRKGSLKSELKQSFVDVDYAWILDSGNIQWDIKEEFAEIQNVSILKTLGDLPDQIQSKIKPGDSLIIMTNSDSKRIINILEKG
jgi:UDP-N-acetylmuramate: L-alanyl-gamma-D-glutamyl-meso-diaminopimelate ligase